MIRNTLQPWIHSPKTDLPFILLPPFLALLVVAMLPATYKESGQMPDLFWLILIVFVDVAHVYSTLYRTYFNSNELKTNYALFTGIPLICYAIGVVLYSISAIIFWRVLAYLAVFHFVRQQYGFMRLYSRKEQPNKYDALIDTVTIYAASLFPILYWHSSPNRNFNWFIEGDFILFKPGFPIHFFFVVYLALLAIYLIKEIGLVTKSRFINIPRNLLIIGTVISWYFGIVHYNGDMAFSAINVIAHGIPYMALIWISERKKFQQTPTKSGRLLKLIFGSYGVLLFLLIVLVLAYLEEGLWDALIWKEHTDYFRLFNQLPQLQDNKLLALAVPLLALPQATHYVLDGFIWKLKKTGEYVQ